MINAHIVALLKEQELFKTVGILDAKYSVIYRTEDDMLIIKSEGTDIPVSDYLRGQMNMRRLPRVTLEWWHRPSCDGFAVTWSLLCRRHAFSKYLAMEAAEWFTAPRSNMIYLAIPEDFTDINVEQACLSIFVSHLNEYEDRLCHWKRLINIK